MEIVFVIVTFLTLPGPSGRQVMYLFGPTERLSDKKNLYACVYNCTKHLSITLETAAYFNHDHDYDVYVYA